MKDKFNDRVSKIQFNKGGNGYYGSRVSIPMSWFLDMGITMENHSTIIVSYDEKEKTIIIKKNHLDSLEEK